MSSEGHRRAKELFLACAELLPDARAAYLDEHCPDDLRLRAEVQAMLDFESRRPDFLDRPATATLSAATSRPPQTIGAFRILRELGQGGMGAVYEAEQDRPHRRVALKLMRGFASPALQRRFEFESELLARLQHPGIAQVYEAGSAQTAQGPQPYFAMELVEGRPLTTFAHEEGLGTRERLALISQVCEAVEHAHQRGVIHRDLKPGNILVTAAGATKVLDFGVARLTDLDVQRTTQRTDVGQVVGTLQYMSPEQASGDPAQLDTRSDVYALGVVAYELLTGRLPYDLSAGSIADAVRVIREQEPEPPSRSERALRGDVETIVLKALEKEKDRRYASAAALAADIGRYLSDEPIEAKPASTAYKLRKFAARNRPLVAATAVILASLVAATLISTRAAVRAADQRDVALAQRERADRRFEEVRALANTLLFDLNDLITPLPGSTPARERIVRTALDYLARLGAEAGDDVQLLAELAEAYARVGDLQGHPRRDNLGQTDAALDSYRKSVALRETLLELDPAPGPHELALATLLQRIGAVHNATGRQADALEGYEQSVELLSGALERDPSDALARRDLGAAHSLVGSTYEQMGRPEESLAACRRSLELAESLVARHPGDPGHERRLSISLNEVGQMLERLGRLDEAQQHVERAYEIRARLHEQSPTDTRARRDLALSLHRVGNLEQARDAHAAALEFFEPALEHLAAIAAADPLNNRARYDLSVAYEKRGSALRELGKLEEALANFRASLELRGTLVQENPENRFHRSAFASTHEVLAEALLRAGRWDEAEAAWRGALEIAEAIAAEYPDDAYSRTVIELTGFRLGGLLVERASGTDSGRSTLAREAQRLLSRSLETLEAMQARGMRPTHGGVGTEDVRELLASCEALLDP